MPEKPTNAMLKEKLDALVCVLGGSSTPVDDGFRVKGKLKKIINDFKAESNRNDAIIVTVEDYNTVNKVFKNELVKRILQAVKEMIFEGAGVGIPIINTRVNSVGLSFQGIKKDGFRDEVIRQLSEGLGVDQNVFKDVKCRKFNSTDYRINFEIPASSFDAIIDAWIERNPPKPAAELNGVSDVGASAAKSVGPQT